MATTVKRKRKSKKVIIMIDPELDKYNNMVLFPGKLEKANAALEKYGIPDLKKSRNK